MPLAPAGEIIALNALLTGSYVALHTAAPSGANEVTGGAYARQAFVFDLAGADPTVAQNTGTLEFPTATAGWGTITHVGIWSASVGGSLLAYEALAASKTINTDDVFRFLDEQLKVTAN
mgnify:CR=1 FL=1